MTTDLRDRIARIVRRNMPATREADDWPAPIADAIIDALPGMVPPLVWRKGYGKPPYPVDFV